MAPPQRILVTGSSGFLGNAIAQHLRAEGFLINALAGRKEFAHGLDAALTGCDAVVHAGFHVNFEPASPGAAPSENVASTQRLLEAASVAGVGHFVFLNAAGILGVSSDPRARNEADVGTTDPTYGRYRDTAYIQDKLACTALLRAQGIPTADLLLTTVYGRGMNPDVGRPLRTIARGPSPLVLFPPGGTSFLALDDFLDALLLVLRNRITGCSILSSGNTTYEGLFETCCEIAGTRWRKTFVRLPDSAPRALETVRRFAPSIGLAVLESAFGYKYYSAEHAARSWGWPPKRTLADALRSSGYLLG